MTQTLHLNLIKREKSGNPMEKIYIQLHTKIYTMIIKPGERKRAAEIARIDPKPSPAHGQPNRM